MTIRGINHITLSVTDLGRSVAFYTEVLGCTVARVSERSAYLEAGSLWLALVADASARTGPLPEYSHVAFDVAVADFAALAEKVRRSGAVIFQDNESEGESLYFLDPDGHKLELHVGSLASRLTAAASSSGEPCHP